MTLSINNNLCSQISPPEFTLEQIEKCQHCRMASKSGKWCGHFGCWIQEGSRIIQPNRRILPPNGKQPMPFPRNNAEYNKNRFNREYKIAVDMAKDSGKQLISEAKFVMRRNACAICPPVEKQGCPCIGCKQWQKLVFAEVRCPKGNWGW